MPLYDLRPIETEYDRIGGSLLKVGALVGRGEADQSKPIEGLKWCWRRRS